MRRRTGRDTSDGITSLDPGDIIHLVMERTQISLTAAQAERLRRIARRRRTSMAALIRDAVERAYPAGVSADAAWDRALASVGGFHSGHRDISANHDAYLGDAFVE